MVQREGNIRDPGHHGCHPNRTQVAPGGGKELQREPQGQQEPLDQAMPEIHNRVRMLLGREPTILFRLGFLSAVTGSMQTTEALTGCGQELFLGSK